MANVRSKNQSSRQAITGLRSPGEKYDPEVFRRWRQILEGVRVTDPINSFTQEEILADQAGAGAALTFTFSAPVQVIYVTCRGGDGRADISGTPTSSSGIKCSDGVPVTIPITAGAVKVYAGGGTTVSVWGAR